MLIYIPFVVFTSIAIPVLFVVGFSFVPLLLHELVLGKDWLVGGSSTFDW